MGAVIYHGGENRRQRYNSIVIATKAVIGKRGFLL